MPDKIDDIINLLKDTQARLDVLESKIKLSPNQINIISLDQLAKTFGLIQAGEFRSGNGLEIGKGFTGTRIVYPAVTYGGGLYHIVGVKSDVLQVGISATDGKIYAGAGAVWLDENGISLATPTAKTNINSYKFMDSSTLIANFWANKDAGSNVNLAGIDVFGNANEEDAQFSIAAQNNGTTKSAYIQLVATAALNTATLGLGAGVGQALSVDPTGVSCTNGLYPKRADMFADCFNHTSGALITALSGVAHPYGYIATVAVANANDLDEYSTSCVLVAGTYTLKVLYAKNTMYGKFDVYVDGVKVSGATPTDSYGASATYNSVLTVTNVSVTYDGRHIVKLKVNGKHASSTDYVLGVTKIWMYQATD